MTDYDSASHHPQVAFDDERVNPALFNLHVVPDLDALIQGYACFVRLEMCDYSEALGACIGYAWRRGAWGFNPTHLAELQDWLHDRLGFWIGPEVA